MYQIFILKKLTKKLAFVKISLYICSMKNKWLDFEEWKTYTKWRKDNEYLPMDKMNDIERSIIQENSIYKKNLKTKTFWRNFFILGLVLLISVLLIF